MSKYQTAADNPHKWLWDEREELLDEMRFETGDLNAPELARSKSNLKHIDRLLAMHADDVRRDLVFRGWAKKGRVR